MTKLLFVASRSLATAICLAICAGMTGARAETVLRMSNWVPPSHLLTREVLGPWMEDVARVTEGRVRIEALKAPLGKPPAHFDIARDGIADITIGVHGYTPGRFVLTQVAELPFLSDSAEKLSVAYWRIHEAYLAAANEHDGVQLLGLWTHGPGHIFNSRKEILRVEDLSGMKFRVGGGLVSEISTALDSVSISAPATKSYELLSNGVADGIYFPTESVVFFNLSELMRHATLVPGGLYNASFFLIANQGRWDKIAPADQAAIMAVSGEVLARRAGAAWDAADAAGLGDLTAAGVRISVADTPMLQALTKRLAFAEHGWVARAGERGVDGAVIAAALRAQIAEVR
jgi:TRAP-type C4-dicarboxylate transport system substrate-binding protein